MREILFRGFDRKTNKMFFVHELTFSRITNELQAFYGYDDWDKDGYTQNGGNINKLTGSGAGRPFKRFELMEYTGLTDKNGVKIFEGDIIKTHYANSPKADFIETVVFYKGAFRAEKKISETGKVWTLIANGVEHLSIDKSVYMEYCEVIGNIHDNPELINRKADEVVFHQHFEGLNK